MFGNNMLINMACNYAERSEGLREQYRAMSQDYLQGRIDQYKEGLIPNIPLVSYIFEPQEIEVIKSVLEEKLQE